MQSNTNAPDAPISESDVSSFTPRQVWSGTFHLVRHGLSLGNVSEEVYHPKHIGNARLPLTVPGHVQAYETGLAMAEALADKPGRKIQVLSSSYLRSMQTAENIWQVLAAHLPQQTHALDPALQVVQSLREIEFGKFTGMRFSDAAERYPDEYEAFRAWRKQDKYRSRAPGECMENREGGTTWVPGESLEVVAERVAQFLPSLMQQLTDPSALASSSDLVLVTHGHVQRALVMALNPALYDEAWYHMSEDPHNGEYWQIPVQLLEVAPGQYQLAAGAYQSMFVPSSRQALTERVQQYQQGEAPHPLQPWLDRYDQKQPNARWAEELEGKRDPQLDPRTDHNLRTLARATAQQPRQDQAMACAA